MIHDIAAKYEETISITDLRKFEKLSLKIRKAKLDIRFLKNCRSFSVVLPNFTKVNLPKVSKSDITYIRKQLPKNAISRRIKENHNLIRTLDKLTNKIDKVLSRLDFYILIRLVFQNVSNETNRFVKIHQEKLENLTRNAALPFSPEKTVTNISTYVLTSDELEILKFGLKHSIRPPKLSKAEIFTCFEQINYTMNKHIKDTKLAGKLVSDLSHLAHL